MSAIFPLIKNSSSLNSFFGDLDRIFETHPIEREFYLSCDIDENEDSIRMEFDVPGVEEKDIEVEFNQGLLRVFGERKRVESVSSEKESEGFVKSRTYKERRFGSFSRKFRLPETVDSSAITASHKNGVLTLILPKKEKAKPVKIQIQN